MARYKGFRIEMNRAAVARVIEAANRAAEMTTREILTDIEKEQVVPMDHEGELSSTATVDRSERAKGRFRIVYTTPYARRLYWHPEYKFQKGYHANARGEWLEPWLKGERKDFPHKKFTRLFKRELLRTMGKV
jgi:hypothetical protein